MVAMSNQTVRQDYANYQQALAEVKVARAELFPTIGITGSATRAGGPGLTGANAAAASTGSTATRSTGVINSATLEGTASLDARFMGTGASFDRGECGDRAVR